MSKVMPNPYAILTSLFFLLFNVKGQDPIQFEKIKNEDKSVKVIAKNTSVIPYDITLNVVLENMKSDKDLPLQIRIEPQDTIDLITLYPTVLNSGKYSLKYNIQEAEDPMKPIAEGITIYTKNKHKRSTQLLIYLNQNGINYRELNTSYDQETQDLFEAMLLRRGINKQEVKMPVIIYNGEAYHQIKNVKKFCKEKFANEGRFIKKSERRY